MWLPREQKYLPCARHEDVEPLQHPVGREYPKFINWLRISLTMLKASHSPKFSTKYASKVSTTGRSYSQWTKPSSTSAIIPEQTPTNPNSWLQKRKRSLNPLYSLSYRVSNKIPASTYSSLFYIKMKNNPRSWLHQFLFNSSSRLVKEMSLYGSAEKCHHFSDLPRQKHFLR